MVKGTMVFGILALASSVSCNVIGPCGDDLSMRVNSPSAALTVGETRLATAEFRGCSGSRRLSDSITWSATDPAVATVTAVDKNTALITARAPGATTIVPRGTRYGTLLEISVTVR
jgi:hypothetical protein